MPTYLEFTKTLAVSAGEKLLTERASAEFDRNYKQGDELVTSADLMLDAFICNAIKEAYPAHHILSEESSPTFSFENIAAEDYVWVIDPIDGTVNFAHGHKHVAISIGLIHQGKRIVGVVNAPFLNELYWAEKGKGAFLNNEAISVSREKNLKRALVATGFPYVKDQLDPILDRVKNILIHCQDIRRNGSAALDLCAVATGCVEAYFESVKPWDLAAGALIAEEAGARVGHYIQPTSSKKLPYELFSEHLLAANSDLYQPIRDLLQ